MWGIGAVGKMPLQRKQFRADRRLKIFTGYSGPRRQVIKFKKWPLEGGREAVRLQGPWVLPSVSHTARLSSSRQCNGPSQ